MTVSTAAPLPHGLALVIDFVNTRDLDEGTDALDSPRALGHWLTEHGLFGAGRDSLGAPDLVAAVALREALRAVLLGHNGGPLDPDAFAECDRVATAGALMVRFGPDGSVGPASRGDGVAAALAAVLVPIAAGAADGTWDRVKACCGEDCAWAFYDRSRNRSGRWCDMAVCGNRVKVRAYRDKRAGD